VARLCLYSRAVKVDATKKRSVMKKRIKLSGGLILLSEKFFRGRRFALINADKKNLPRMNAKDANLVFVFIPEIGGNFLWYS
jgi:hypothetical protein